LPTSNRGRHNTAGTSNDVIRGCIIELKVFTNAVFSMVWHRTSNNTNIILMFCIEICLIDWLSWRHCSSGFHLFQTPLPHKLSSSVLGKALYRIKLPMKLQSPGLVVADDIIAPASVHEGQAHNWCDHCSSVRRTRRLSWLWQNPGHPSYLTLTWINTQFYSVMVLYLLLFTPPPYTDIKIGIYLPWHCWLLTLHMLNIYTLCPHCPPVKCLRSSPIISLTSMPVMLVLIQLHFPALCLF